MPNDRIYFLNETVRIDKVFLKIQFDVPVTDISVSATTPNA